MLFALLALLSKAEPEVVHLYRGATVKDQVFRYWDCSSTTLDSQSPDQPGGSDPGIMSGQGKVILLRFGDLNRIVGGRKVKRARIILTSSPGQPLHLRRFAELQRPFRQGPRATITSILRKPAPGAKPEAWPLKGATWKEAYQGHSWQSLGARGPQDASMVTGVQVSEVEPGKYALEGFQPIIEKAVAHPSQDRGFAIEFDEDREFASCEAQSGQPELELTLEQQPFVGKLVLVSAAPTVTGFSVKVTNFDSATFDKTVNLTIQPYDGRPVDFPLHIKVGAGETVQLPVDYQPAESGLPVPLQAIAFFLPTDICDAAHAEVVANKAATPIDIQIDPRFAAKLNEPLEAWVARQIRFLNETVIPYSRSTIYPDGGDTAVQVRGVKSGPSPASEAYIPSLYLMKLTGLIFPEVPEYTELPYCDFAGFPDTRFDGVVHPTLNLPQQPVPNPLTALVGRQSTDLLSPTSISLLANMTPRYPKVNLIKVLYWNGTPIAKAPISLTGLFAAPGGGIDKDLAGDFITDNEGFFTLPGKKNATNDKPPFDYENLPLIWPDIEVKRFGRTSNGVLPSSLFWDAYLRGNHAIYQCDVYVNVPFAPIGTDDLAAGKLVTGSEGLPADLNKLTSKGGEIEFPGNNGGWVEVDLGRDRSVASVEVDGGTNAFEVRVYGTGQTIADSALWGQCIDRQWHLNAQSLDGNPPGVIPFYSRPQQVRYIRLISRTNSKGKIKAIHVYAPASN